MKSAPDSNSTTQLSYKDLMKISQDSLGPDEVWVIDHDEGPIWETAATRMDVPVRVFCDALKCDWDHALDSGFRLARMKREKNDAR
jgi:hypothetical protein